MRSRFYFLHADIQFVVPKCEFSFKYSSLICWFNMFTIEKNKEMFLFLLKKAQKEYYENLDLQNVTSTQKFWETVKPVYENEVKTCNSNSLIEKSVITSEKALGKALTFFVNIALNLSIDVYNVSEVTKFNTSSIEKCKNLVLR